MATRVASEKSLIGTGIYSIPEASRLVKIAPARIKRWVAGYDWATTDKSQNHSEAVWKADYNPIEEVYALSFKDLIEIRFVDSFLKAGVSWKELRNSATIAAKLLDASHPFSTHRFKTDGRRIFAEIGEQLSETKLLELSRSQYAFHQIIQPSLYEGLEYQAEELKLWRPSIGQKKIVLDPKRSFGQPITDDGSVPTATIIRSLLAEGEGSEKRVARWYEIPLAAVHAAKQFETSLRTDVGPQRRAA